MAALAATLVLAQPVSGAESFAWVYAGHSVQADAASNRPFPAMLQLTADGRAVDVASFAERYSCPSGDTFTDRITLTGMPVRSDGTWGKTRKFSGGVTVAISGKLTGATATFQVTSSDDEGCRARTAYSLTRGPTSYGGNASNDYPVSVRLSTSRSEIAELTLFLSATCRDPKGERVEYRAPAQLTAIPVRKGAFARTGAYRYAFRGSGAIVTVSWTLRGTVGERRTSGSLGYVVSAVFKDGEKVFQGCRSSMSWKATTA